MPDTEFQDHTVSNQIQYDKNGNAVGVILDGTAYRLQVETDFPPGFVLEVAPLGSVTSDPANVVNVELQDTGGSSDLNVDGSGSPVDFKFDADPTDDIFVSELRFVMVASQIRLQGDRFGPFTELTNGLQLRVTAGGSTDAEIANLKLSEDFMSLISPAGVFLDTSGANDTLAVGLSFGGRVKLAAGSSDQVKITVRDNLSGPGQGNDIIRYFRAILWGFKL